MIRRLLDKLLHVEDDPSDRCYHNRRWRWTPIIELDRRGRALYIGISLDLVQYDGKPHSPRAVHYRDFSLHPFDWQIGQDHVYYDGPHCCYKLGPFRFSESWRRCAKCEPVLR